MDFIKVDDTVLGPESEKDVMEAVINMAARYDSVGRMLGLSSSELEAITRGCLGDPKRALGHVVTAWLKQSYNVERFGLPSWRTLVKAVNSPAGGYNRAQAKRIASSHQVRKRAPEASLGGCSPKVPRRKALHTPLLKFRPKLADFYSKKTKVPEGTWPPVKKTHYINLALIKQQAINFSKEIVRQTIRGSIDDVIKDKEEIKYEDAFNDLDDGVLVIVEGRPGCGKTTLMHKLSEDWEKYEVLASHLVLLVHFRRFSNRSDIELSDILRAASMDFTDEDIKQLCTYIQGNRGRGIVFALDGLDEYSPQLKNNVLHSIIKREYLSNAVVIVASRPAASQKFRKYATKHVEVIGFLVPQIKEYVVNYFDGCQDKAQGLLKYLDNHLNIMHMCYLPLHTAMVTYLYDMEGASLPQTETEIYRHFTLWTLVRTFLRRDDDQDTPFFINDFDQLPSGDKRIFHLILKLAYTATIQSKQVFTLEEVKEHISEQLPSSGTGADENSLGLIVIDRYFVKYGLDEIYTFHHLTLQEFLAAYYIADQVETEQTIIIGEHGSKENLAEVWKFFCGIGKCSLENFKLLLDKSKCRVQKKRSSAQMIPNVLLHVRCAYESQKTEVCTQVVETHGSNISFHDRTLSPSDMTALGYVLVNSKTQVKELALTSCRVGKEGFVAVAAEVGDHKLAIETLSFQGTTVTKEMSKEFAALLGLCPSIKSLNISKCVKAKKVLAEISSNVSALSTLNISSNPLDKSGSAVSSLLDKLPNLETLIVHIFKDPWYIPIKEKIHSRNVHVKMVGLNFESSLDLATCTEINLCDMKVYDRDAMVLAENLKECTNLVKFRLSVNQIGDTGAVAIAESMKLCPTLQDVRLAYNQIGDTGAVAIAESIKLCPTLQHVELDRNQIGDTGAVAIAGSIKLCPTLQHVELVDNKIGDTGAVAIAESIKLCPTLQYILLTYNSITDASVPHLVEVIGTARNLKTFYLHGNNFTEDGTTQLRQATEKRNSDPANDVHLDLSC